MPRKNTTRKAEQPLPALRRDLTVSKVRLAAVLQAGRARVYAEIAKRAKDPAFAANGNVRERVFAKVGSHYDRMATDLDQWSEELARRTGGNFFGRAARDTGTARGSVRYSREYAERHLRLVHERNAPSLAAVHARRMGANDVAALRSVVIGVINEAAVSGMGAREVRREMMRRMDERVAEGLPSWRFLDKGGRAWAGGNYFDMLTRTLTSTVARAGYVDGMVRDGFDLATIEGGGDPCPACAAWRGVVVSVSGANKDFPSLKDAEADGVFHPNCFISHKTRVMTSRGWRQINRVAVGDLVLTHLGRFRKVAKLHRIRRQRPECSVLVMEGGRRLTVTTEHPVMADGRWTAAGAVRPGRRLAFLAAECERCGALTVHGRRFCSKSCASATSTENQWKDPEHRRKMTEQARTRLVRGYANGTIDRIAVTRAAMAATRAAVAAGTHPFQRSETHVAANRALAARHGGGTWLERRFAWALRQRGMRPMTQHPIPSGKKDAMGRDRYFFADFAFPARHLAVEVDGVRWHDVERDVPRQRVMEKQGWTVLRYGQARVDEDLMGCADEVGRVLANHAHQYRFTDKAVRRTRRFIPGKPVTLWNLSVVQDESFVVAGGFVVHNCCCEPRYVDEETDARTIDAQRELPVPETPAAGDPAWREYARRVAEDGSVRKYDPVREAPSAMEEPAARAVRKMAAEAEAARTEPAVAPRVVRRGRA